MTHRDGPSRNDDGRHERGDMTHRDGPSRNDDGRHERGDMTAAMVRREMTTTGYRDARAVRFRDEDDGYDGRRERGDMTHRDGHRRDDFDGRYAETVESMSRWMTSARRSLSARAAPLAWPRTRAIVTDPALRTMRDDDAAAMTTPGTPLRTATKRACGPRGRGGTLPRGGVVMTGRRRTTAATDIISTTTTDTATGRTWKAPRSFLGPGHRTVAVAAHSWARWLP